MNLRDNAIANIEDALDVFTELKMTNKLRFEISEEMLLIATNAFYAGYHARALEDDGEADDFKKFKSTNELLNDITFRIHNSGVTA